MAAFARRAAGEPVSKIELHISCQNLLNKDVTSKSDPCCVVSIMDESGHWQEIGRTENIKNCLNPTFAKTFEIDYFFEQVQKVLFMVYDVDNTTPKLSDDDFLGQLECTLGEIVSNSTFIRPLFKKGNHKAGTSTITLTTNEVAKMVDILMMNFKAQKLDNKDFLGKSDPFLEFSRSMPNGAWQVVHRTEVVKNDLNPTWRPLEIKASRLCSVNCDQPVKVDCYDYDSDGSHDLIGTFTTSVTELLKAASGTPIQWPCVNLKKKDKKGYQNSGTVHLTSCRISKDYSFLDFIFGGLQINFTVGVDFTASNGNPKDVNSLHFLNPNMPNQYMKAIQSVGEVIQDYDSDQMFPALGFGAKIPPNMQVSHEFALSFNAANPFCAGIRGVLDAYRYCLSQVQLYGPTNFAPIIYHVARFAAIAQKENSAKNYFVLLILTDGAITDVDETIKAIVYCSTLPLSIIIIGVGHADFTTMNILDADDKMLKDCMGHVAKRDIVQFVPFRDYERCPPAALAKQVLAEVPRQVCDYFRMCGIVPGAGVRQVLAALPGPAGQQPTPSA